MKKSTKIAILVIAILAIIAVVVAVVINLNKRNNDDKKDANQLGEIASAQDLEKIIDKLYEGREDNLPALQTQQIEVTDDITVNMLTGLQSGQDLEFLVASEPLISSQAYSLVIAKVKNGVDANKIAKNMNDNVDQRKWICVSAEKVYSTSSGDVVFLIMSSEETAKPIYEKFKSLAGTVGKEYVKEEPEIELPPEML